ncbi:DUF3526 domain-containing protein [Spirosoma montaniterrae]|uniref:ABC transporter permease n=1 Tax=Spirosoma montaniterrae TaxID=1178516 RepID=A0A1P9WXW1_9BACT|nr:DUF3526 domain-containing protein [Spirosoma montaniterrae]AQG80193.1 hypothetical protein AWR27_13220 [Spirosoma montaniterrae]
MFRHITRYDFLALRANRLLLIVPGLLSAFVLIALWTGWQRTTFQRDTLAAIAQQERADYAHFRQQIAQAKPGQHFDGGHFGDPTNPFYFGNRMGARYATLPPYALALTSVGQGDLYPYYYKLTLSKRQALYHSEELENPRVLFNGAFDLSFVIIYLLPLLIIAFTYNLVSSEREQGTLALLLTETAPLSQVAGYRYMFRYVLINGLFSMLVVSGLLLFGVPLGQAVGEVAYLLLLTALYSAFWFALSFLVNSFGRESGYNAALLVGLWLGFVLLIPTVLAVCVDSVHPMPSRIDLITQSRDAADELAKDKGTVARFYEEHPEFTPKTAPDPKDRTVQMLRSRLEVELAMEGVLEQFAQRMAERQAMVSRYRFLSPAVFMQQSLNDVAGTGESRYADFERQVTDYHAAFRNYFAPLVYRMEKFTPAHLDRVPKFRYVAPGGLLFTPANWQNLLYLVVATLGCITLATIRIRQIKLAY